MIFCLFENLAILKYSQYIKKQHIIEMSFQQFVKHSFQPAEYTYEHSETEKDAPTSPEYIQVYYNNKLISYISRKYGAPQKKPNGKPYKASELKNLEHGEIMKALRSEKPFPAVQFKFVFPKNLNWTDHTSPNNRVTIFRKKRQLKRKKAIRHN